MVRISTLLTLVGFLPLSAVFAFPQYASSTSTALPTATAVVPGLNYLARNSGKLYFGTATDNPELNDTTYTSIMDNYLHFGQLTPANSMKWYATEPEPGVFTFEAGDVIANLARSYGMYLRGHNCVWYEELPDWVTANNYTAPELAEIVANHTGTVVGHYAGQADAWDVINGITTTRNMIIFSYRYFMIFVEPLNDNGTFREDVFYDTLGESYISIALRAARAADPHAKLYINDYNTEYVGVKSTALQNLVKQLQADGVPIDGVGFESHFIVGEVPTTIVENMQAFAALGLEFAITELDIRMELPATVELYEQQKTDYYTVVSACMQVEQCVGVTVWDWTDKYSWIPSSFPGYGDACPWDANFVRKPAFDGIAIAFENQSDS
ncbi:glycoside hydrolase family 10 protein [Postia placenta MAD-698-R-SB12]|uniref:Beta-xylanase n=1 Tax=Postia placenta MAD-698-R-SB12 TaxID=670580 RepID=A0A1X6NDN2_9APHY|nr:glycoside hydrolase family 10 protein [Postia placenta MAD-698-R-SB12]OSX66630.1 glycoside hydrolase family 10 protein [Postia placenta MAD-698-R-SB12]